MLRAAIDIGSNSILLLVVDQNGKVLRDLSVIVGLGKGLGDSGNFQDDRIQMACRTLADYAQEAVSLGVAIDNIHVAATSAARRAQNADVFIQRVHTETGLYVEIIDGEREAELTWMGARDGLTLPDSVIGVVDLGGGSTEVVTGKQNSILSRYSMEIGTVRLTEMVCREAPDVFRASHKDHMRLEASKIVNQLSWEIQPKVLVAVAGTATTLAAAEIGLEKWDADQVHGFWLSRTALNAWETRLLDCSRAQRKALVRASPKRADTVLAGACILGKVCDSAGVDGLRISVGGIRHGLVATQHSTNI